MDEKIHKAMKEHHKRFPATMLSSWSMDMMSLFRYLISVSLPLIPPNH